ncbi:alpha/beta hydrolase [Rhodanobacter sp. B2A1Ga4]|uniref:alpha/beta hydrolase family protein n=1 Tax=Rhodanobacter sp. B2A1Ga4 TaxID=2778647 RepID=UPI001B358428|nr:alpha/beta fold hydrolase [Rhodanobacter sp. B2A1Ga4]MBQ4853172.1 alpha/beta hydrolase [Rhodanobacter sp. B2A1Ga4]
MHRAATATALLLVLAGMLGLAPARLHAQPAADTSIVTAAKGGDRAEMQTMQIPSHGKLMNALVYVAAGAGPHPAVILLHGFPGNERNLDLAQDMRRAGWDVLYFNYRGSWGTPGDFSFAHGIEDTAAALAYLRQPGVAGKLRLDPNRIVLIGHSMGGFMAVEAAAGDPAIKAFATISAADLGGRLQSLRATQGEHQAIARASEGLADEGMAPLAGCTPDGLARELLQHGADWSFQSRVDALKNRSVLVVTSDDGLAAENNAFAAALRKAGDTRVSTKHLPTDHAYSDQRLELSKTVLAWLAGLPN